MADHKARRRDPRREKKQDNESQSRASACLSAPTHWHESRAATPWRCQVLLRTGAECGKGADRPSLPHLPQVCVRRVQEEWQMQEL